MTYLSKQLAEKIAEMHLQGQNICKIANELKISKNTVSRMILKFNLCNFDLSQLNFRQNAAPGTYPARVQKEYDPSDPMCFDDGNGYFDIKKWGRQYGDGKVV